jgi:hypothetical protein
MAEIGRWRIVRLALVLAKPRIEACLIEVEKRHRVSTVGKRLPRNVAKMPRQALRQRMRMNDKAAHAMVFPVAAVSGRAAGAR